MRLSTFAVAVLFTAVASTAQVTGVPGMNNYTIAPGCSGPQSCTSCCFLTPVTLTCNVSTAPARAVIFYFSFCPCTTCFMAGPVNSCVPAIPSTACGSTTNQAFEVLLGCVSSSSLVLANTAGVATFSLPVPPLGPAAPCSINLATQAVVIDPCGAGLNAAPGPFVFTQAYSLNFW
jgi:hypothetical protein